MTTDQAEKNIKLECIKLAIQLHPRANEDKIMEASEAAYVAISQEWSTELKSKKPVS